MADRQLPRPKKTESRTCFGISWFGSEEDAATYAEHVKAMGYTYNGGFFHGMQCGRDTAFDYDDPEHGHLYAVTD